MDKESLDLVNNAYRDAKHILNQNYDKLIEFSELLMNNTIVTKEDIGRFIF
jgi:ATP-dependent Zn protease